MYNKYIVLYSLAITWGSLFSEEQMNAESESWREGRWWGLEGVEGQGTGGEMYSMRKEHILSLKNVKIKSKR